MERDEIKRLFISGKTMAEIATLTGVSRQAISARLHRMGIKADQGGLAKRVMEKAMGLASARDAKARSKWGCSYSEVSAIRREYGARPFKAFIQHRKNASKRGIEFLLSFSQWWEIWQKSGRWNLRGKLKDGRHGYVMARMGDRGPYEQSNVCIKTQSSNMDEYWLTIREIGRHLDNIARKRITASAK